MLADGDPKGALAGFKEVVSMEDDKGEWGFKAHKQMVCRAAPSSPPSPSLPAGQTQRTPPAIEPAKVQNLDGGPADTEVMHGAADSHPDGGHPAQVGEQGPSWGPGTRSWIVDPVEDQRPSH